MYYVYIIKSRKNGKTYLGCTSDLKKRIERHNKALVYSTKYGGPWEVRYYEAYHSKKNAFDREKQLKRHAKGMIELKKRLVESLG
jgi:putative endonuclease